MAAPTIGTVVKGDRYNAGDKPVTMPTLAEDDYALVVFGVDSGETWTSTPSEFTEISENAGSAVAISAYYAKEDGIGTLSGNVFTWNHAGEEAAWLAIPISGADLTTFLDVAVVTGSETAAVANSDAPSITPVNSDTLVFHCMAADRAGTTSGANGFTTIPATETGWSTQAGLVRMAVSHGTFGASATGTKNFVLDTTAWGNRAMIALTIAVRSADTGGSIIPQGSHGISRGINPHRVARLGGVLET